MKHDSFNESAEMYLKTAIELAEGDAPVPISALAARLGVSPVSATEMIHRLEEHGLLRHLPYKGVVLTAQGRRQAAVLIRSHRLWERFLSDYLGLPWEEVHEMACRLEHATGAVVTDALAAYMGDPVTCPHGNPIPDADGATEETADRPLAGLPPGCAAVITRVYPESGELLDYLVELDLVTGARVQVQAISPFQGPLVVRAEGGLRYLGQEAAAQVYVRPLEEAR